MPPVNGAEAGTEVYTRLRGAGKNPAAGASYPF